MKDAVKNFFEGKISRNDFLKVLVNSLKERCFLDGEFPNLTNKIEHDTDKILPDFCGFFPKIRTLGYIPLKYGTDDREHVAFFAVTCAKELSERSYRRKQFDFAQKIADLPGEIGIWFDTNHSDPGNAVFLFIAPDGKSFRLSLIERDKSKEKKIFKRYTFFVSADQRNRTFFDRIGSDKNKKWETFSDLRETFSVEKLSDDFFKAYTETHYQDFVSYATGVRMGYKGKKWVVISRTDPNQEIMEQFAPYADPDKALRDYVKKMMGRLVFLQFLQKKGWLGVPEGAEWGNGDKEYLKNLFDSSRYQDDFLEKVLELLFFETLNKDRRPEKDIAADVLAFNGGKVRIPYLNGGLFEKDELDKAKIKFPPEYFSTLFETFERYNFTIDENDPDDKEVGVDPEMLGRIFENLLEDNKDKGAFYTPKEIVQYMCEESLIAYLGDTEANRKLVKDFDVEDITDPKALLEKLEDVKICDPAIGSGAFPMGMLNILYRLRLILEGKEFSPANIVKVKKEIIQNNIYGVDIEAGAVDIARLRFWLSIVVDEKKPLTLPNLDYKIMQGNSLLEQYNGVDLSKICNFLAEEETGVKKGKRIQKKKDADETILLDLYDDTSFSPEAMHKTIEHYFTIQSPEKEKYKNLINGKVQNCIKTALKQESVEIDWKNNDKFFLWHTFFWDVFNEKGGFDIVIGNPPYVLLENLPSESACIYNNLFVVAAYKVDLYHLFFEMGIQLLNEKGILTYITSNSYLTNKHTVNLRSFILENTSIQSLLLHDEAVFTTPNVEVATIILRKGYQKTSKIILQKHSKQGFAFLGKQQQENWRLTANKNFSIYTVDVNAKNSVSLKDICEIYFGIQAFDKDSSTFTTRVTGNCLPIIDGSDFNSYSYAQPRHFFDFLPCNIKSGGKKEVYQQERIVIRQIGKVPVVGICREGILSSNTMYSVFLKKDSQYRLYYILSVLNSKFIQYYWTHKYSDNKNLFPKIKKCQLVNLPIPEAESSTQEKIESLAKRILSESEPNKETLQQEIDSIINKLYGLTEEEISIVEASFEKTAAAETGKKKRGKKAAAVAEPVINDDNDEVDGDL